MHALNVIKNACIDALDEDDPCGIDTFRAVVDPHSVLELADIVESLLRHIEETGTGDELVSQARYRLGLGS